MFRLKTKNLTTCVLLTSSVLIPEGGSTILAQTNLSPEMVTQDSKDKFTETLRKNTTTISFSKESATLTELERETIIAAVNNAKNSGVISRVIVAAWSDKDYPAAKGASLHKKDIEIARARVASIQHVLETANIKEIETYTMTENPSWFGRLFNTAETKVKGVGKPDGKDDRILDDIGNMIRDRGGAGKAVVIVRKAGDGVAH